MSIEGKWWALYEEEPLDMDRSRSYDLLDGAVFDGRTGKALGWYEVTPEGANITLADQPGDETVIQFRMAGPFDPSCVRYGVNYTTAGFELHRANWSQEPAETDEEEFELEDWVNEHFGTRLNYGTALRDGPNALALHRRNKFRVVEAA